MNQQPVYLMYAIWLGIGALFYFLYINGYLIVNAKRALMFVGAHWGKGIFNARFTSCSGYVKRVIRFSESREYRLNLEQELAKGRMWAEILNKKEVVARVSAENPSVTFRADSKVRYRIVFRFEKASGRYRFWYE